MALSREQFLLQRRRIRAVMDYMDQHLDDEALRLDTLADVAHLSRFHFERLYAEKVGESPIATLRRLRLTQARQRLLEGASCTITELAGQAGYGSVAAFSRAFVRAFDQAPSRLLVLPALSRDPVLEIISLPAVPVLRTPYSGRATDVFEAGHEVNWAVHNAGARGWRHWAVHPEGWIDPQRQPDSRVRMWHCIPAFDIAFQLPGVERGFLPAGDYARFAFVGRQRIDVPALIARVAAETSWRAVPGPMLRHYPKVPHYTPVAERVEHFYLSVAPN
ncbi:hypothetical protein GCM10027046_34620 [Uliginosibacterium flavum]|uniref:AraC family transcriptional regulator n=1 Tax=Uliginosibacterium flavum TaxID=1396831 RepID=A0ABV2TMI6_9RHOO